MFIFLSNSYFEFFFLLILLTFIYKLGFPFYIIFYVRFYHKYLIFLIFQLWFYLDSIFIYFMSRFWFIFNIYKLSKCIKFFINVFYSSYIVNILSLITNFFLLYYEKKLNHVLNLLALMTIFIVILLI